MDAAGEALLGGRYRLGELLGVGGSATVYAADDLAATEGEEPRVAVKVLHPHLCVDEASRGMFLREAERAGALDHPNIVRVRGVGIHDAAGIAMPWIALDLLVGPTLRDQVSSGGPLAPAAAAAVLDGVLAGLAAAHAAGVIHRDLTPQNIVLGADGVAGDPAIASDGVRIVDFGLADVTGHATLGGDPLLAARGDHVVGSAAYMSPEQASGLPVRSVSDLYQAGCVLYFALTGREPFPRATGALTLRAHVDAPPPAPSVLASSARPLDRLVIRALAKTPAHRFRSADEFRTELRAIATGLPTASRRDGEASALDASVPTATRLLPPVAEPRTEAIPPFAPRPRSARSGGVLRPEPGLASRRSSLRRGRAPSGTTVVVTGLLLALLGGAGWNAFASTASQPSPVPSAAATTAAPIASSGPTAVARVATPRPPAVVLPALSGTLTEVQAALAALGLDVGAVVRVDSPAPTDQLLGQQPVAGTPLHRGDRVDLTVASGRNAIPTVAGLSLPTAIGALQSAGFAAVVDDPRRAGSVPVLNSDPAASVVLGIGSRVTLITGPDQPAPVPPSPPAPVPASPSPTPVGWGWLLGGAS